MRFEVVDAGALEFDDNAFDVVTCQFGVMFFPDKPASYREARRVLRPAGRYIFNVWDTWAENPFARITHEAVEAFFPEDPPLFYRVPFSNADPDAIRKSLLDAGFATVAVEHVPLTVAIWSPPAFARSLVFGNPMLLEITERGASPEAVSAAVTEALERELGGEMSLRALVIDAGTA